MEEFEQAEQGSHPAKEQTGSQQRYPPSGPGNFTGEFVRLESSKKEIRPKVSCASD
ncbi:hypothetical protein E2542_SST00105 [Spatholobus suberectus]|nr:hypothetical protein E2542_SST00105 [Spatholobus suberectus]